MFNLKLSQVCRDQLKLLLTDILQLPNQSSEYFQDFRKTKSVTNYKNILEKILKDKPLNLSEKKINEWQNVVTIFQFIESFICGPKNSEYQFFQPSSDNFEQQMLGYVFSQKINSIPNNELNNELKNIFFQSKTVKGALNLLKPTKKSSSESILKTPKDVIRLLKQCDFFVTTLKWTSFPNQRNLIVNEKRRKSPLSMEIYPGDTNDDSKKQKPISKKTRVNRLPQLPVRSPTSGI